jgi:aryl-alcohol dehydrogenase-like predicted oxidoreductase
MTELALGTVAFGVDYGITNTAGAPSDDVILSILDVAHEAGVTLFDTAADYGTAQQRLGQLATQDAHRPANKGTKRRFVTKFSLPTDGSRATSDNLYRQSMAQLRVAHLEGVLFHKLSDLSDDRTAEAVEILREGRQAGLLSRIGVSVYNEIDLAHALEVIPDLSLVQLPANVFDRRLLDSALLTELVRNGLHVHVRSAFLQGLVFANPNELPDFFAPLAPSLTAVRDEATARGVSVQSVALSALKFHPNVSAVVVGAQSASEMEEIVRAWRDATELPLLSLDAIPEPVLDPRQWPSTKVTS